MSHSHLAIRHLVRQLELKRNEDLPRPSPPAWLIETVESLSQLFEPFSGVARVGFECLQGGSGWELALFLGENEIIGGPEDGELRAVNFRFDLKDLGTRFDSIQGVYWNAFPNSHVCFNDAADLSFLTVEGTVQGHALRLQIHAAPPDSVGPAFKQYPDGRLEMV